MNAYNKRIRIYGRLSSQLALLSDARLTALLENSSLVHTGMGGSAVELDLDGTKIFAKKIPLTDLELQLENLRSTANIFQLPLYFQYGVGSGGFSTWRDLAMHIMCSNWVLSNECANFPLMYHWRILPAVPIVRNVAELEQFEEHIKYWNDSDAIRQRLQAKLNASSQAVIFLEHFPYNLYNWLGIKLAEGGANADAAISMVEEKLATITKFINAHGVMHFDAHLWNIVTDGDDLHFTDFGLTMSDQFELSAEEIKFLELHANYDRCSTVTNLVHRIITGIYGEHEEPGELQEEHFPKILQEYLDNKLGILSPTLDRIIKRYAPIALVMDKFYRALRHESKTTLYPANELALHCSKY
jgi:hypothetical protein